MVSPLLDLERWIRDVTVEYAVTDEQLEAQDVIVTPRAVLEWSYLRFVQEHPAKLDVPTRIIRGDLDEAVPLDALSRFVGAPGVDLVQVEGGPHLLGRPPHLDTVVVWFEERYPG